MTSFGRVSYTDARNSVHNHIGRDQTNITCHVYILPSTPEHSPTVSHPGINPPLMHALQDLGHFEASSRETAGSTANHLIAARLIVEIVQSLMASDASDQFRDLKEGLNILQQTLDLTGMAIEAYQCTPLGHILANAMGKETEQCIGVLRELLSAIRAYQRSFGSTRTIFSWSRRSGSGYEFGEIRIWQQKLSVCQKSLGSCLQVLDSYVLFLFHILASLK